MRLIILILITFLCDKKTAYGIQAPQAKIPGIKADIAFFEFQEADHTIERRFALQPQYHHQVFDHIYGSAGLSLMPDMTKDTKKVSIRQSLYSIMGGIGVFYSKFFRFIGEFGSHLTYEKVEYEFEGATMKTLDSWIFGWYGRAGMEYTISENWEVGIHLGWFGRPSDSKIDEFTSWSLLYRL